MALDITVRLDDAVPAGKFRLSITGGASKLHGLAFNYGQRLACGSCSCERIEDLLTMMAEELEISSGRLELKVGKL